MPHEILQIAAILGFACQLIGIFKATSSIQEFRQQVREWAKHWFERLAQRNNTATATLEAPPPRLVASIIGHPPPDASLGVVTEWTYENISGISKQTAAVLAELNKFKEEIKSEQTQRNEADKQFGQILTKLGHATWFVFIGTLVLALAELAMWLLNAC